MVKKNWMYSPFRVMNVSAEENPHSTEITHGRVHTMTNERLAKQLDFIHTTGFGVEIEMNSITRENAAKTAAEFFGTGRYVNTARHNGYSSWSAWDAQGREWKFQKDVSITGPDSQKCEMVTPILHYEDMESLQELTRRLRKAGARSDYTRMCGVHIHVQETGQTPETIRNLINLMASHEVLLVHALRVSWQRIERYCKMVNIDFLNELNRKKPKTMEELADLWYTKNGAAYGRTNHYNQSRYTMCNLHSLFTGKGIEFRFFQFDPPADGKMNGLNAGQLKAYIQLSLALCAAARTQKCASPKETQHDNEKYAMRTWLLRLGFVGDEFKTAREVLTKRLLGDTAFRNGRTAA